MLRLTIGAALALSGIATPGWATEVSPSASVAIKARLFHSTSGELSVDVLGSGAPPLVNVVAGADPSKSSLVIVAVTLAPDQVIASDSHLRFVAQELAPAGGACASPVLRPHDPLKGERRLSAGPISGSGSILEFEQAALARGIVPAMNLNAHGEFVQAVHRIAISTHPLADRVRKETTGLLWLKPENLPDELRDEFSLIKRAIGSPSLDNESPQNIISRIVSLSYRIPKPN